MVTVIGGGISGLGTAWDLVLRGVEVTVCEMGDLGDGTSGRFHGLLHGGGRYAVTDPRTAAQCAHENRILRAIAPFAIEPTGGLFVQVAEDQDGYARTWLDACRACGVTTEPVSSAAVRADEPGLSDRIRRAYRVEDAVIEGFELLFALAAAIRAAGGRILTRTRVVGVQVRDGRVAAVDVETADGGRERLETRAVVSCAGPYAGEVSALFGDPLTMRLSGGVALIFAHRQTHQVVNRLAPPGDGDILVPHKATSIWGTTDVAQDTPGPPPVRRVDVRRLLALGTDMFPEMVRWRPLRAFAGVRPLYEPGGASDTAPTAVSRDFTLVDHGRRGGVEGTFTLVGGKFATYRLMAAAAADAVAAHLGVVTPSSTADTVLEPAPRPTPSVSWPTAAAHRTAVVCECEGVTAGQVAAHAADSLASLRTATWLGMGPCQGTFCVHRAAAISASRRGELRALDEARAFVRERERGLSAWAYGGAARQWLLARAVHSSATDLWQDTQ
jgi:glycerol-3-phosphate dehydrogenase